MKIRIAIATSNGLDLAIRTVARQDENFLKEVSLMRLPSDYRFVSALKGQSHLNRKRRIEKIRGDEFGEELAEAMHQKESEVKNKNVLPPRYIGY